jgi:hypothetical protein
MLLLYKELVGSILDYASVCYSGMARTHFLKLERLQYLGLRIVNSCIFRRSSFNKALIFSRIREKLGHFPLRKSSFAGINT